MFSNLIVVNECLSDLFLRGCLGDAAAACSFGTAAAGNDPNLKQEPVNLHEVDGSVG